MLQRIGDIPILLFVDDDDLVLSSLQAFFAAAGYETLASRAIGEALRLCKRFEIRPAAAILNYHLNDGLTFDERIALLAESLPNLPLAVLTGDTTEQTAAIVRNRGVSLLYKPISPLDILSYVRGLVAFGTVQEQGNWH